VNKSVEWIRGKYFEAEAYCEEFKSMRKVKNQEVLVNPIATSASSNSFYWPSGFTRAMNVWLEQWGPKVVSVVTRRPGLRSFFVHSSDKSPAPTLAASLDQKFSF